MIKSTRGIIASSAFNGAKHAPRRVVVVVVFLCHCLTHYALHFHSN